MEEGAGDHAGWQAGRYFHAMRTQAALPPGDYIVEVDGNKFPFPAGEGEVLEIEPQ